ncbi:MAG: hypothetical protein UU85_C0004G0153 [Candidatus Wolfebacteria bacterium GW2011_GWA2_42_10]|uniref:Uncharacterized protein n=2 Tax=Candidatus Wolfeibacteriota TaxID=1752735 RepID=A0A0G0XKG4_9BACT|nr:MAG: hypothetical protein UU38_C0005G0005 [Candidatus Wolfebacteria bacterium GW2011_GWB1_41_12]KKS25394.1 MAG: hypothetical protein UU85_C0004G0153 [Candidatus Wolfebacteria bacterium GW2011_GWA2_42_10]KKT56833.1 MAG: hypothetical protein UW50_C0001G0402 [Candidatus Wolfebacteria bacterium GW2011_GWA1_44_24]
MEKSKNEFEGNTEDSDIETAVAGLRDKMLAIIRENPVGASERINEFGRYLQSEYPDCLDYRAYHLLIGSTPQKKCSKFDFFGEDSVENFLNSLAGKNPGARDD